MRGKIFKPFPVLKTGRLTLRQLDSSDDNEILALRSNNIVNKYLDRKPATSIDDAKNFIQTINKNIQCNQSIYWAITLNGSHKLIGTICLFDFSENNSQVEIGFELLPEFQGKGIMKEATSEVIHFGFNHLELHLIEAYTHSQNQSSTRLLEKLDFKKDSGDYGNLMLLKLTRNA